MRTSTLTAAMLIATLLPMPAVSIIDVEFVANCGNSPGFGGFVQMLHSRVAFVACMDTLLMSSPTPGIASTNFPHLLLDL